MTKTLSNRVRATSSLVALTLALAPLSARADDPPAPAAPAGPPPATAPAPAPPKPLDSLRERFREGSDKYESGAFAEAVVIWESVYRELGPDKGYRVAFDLARAYGELGEQIKAAEHYETYLERVAARRVAGETLDPSVAKHEADARERLEKIAAIKARIRVKPVAHTVLVHVDNAPARVAGFTVYVEPGDHRVMFGVGPTADVRSVTVARGELLELEPPAAAPVMTTRETQWETRVDHPFSPTVLWIGAGVAVMSFLVPTITYANALSIKSDYDDQSKSSADRSQLASDYASARKNAYTSILVPAVFTAGVGALVVWYVLGTKETRVPIAPQPTFGPTGASLDLTARF